MPVCTKKWSATFWDSSKSNWDSRYVGVYGLDMQSLQVPISNYCVYYPAYEGCSAFFLLDVHIT